VDPTVYNEWRLVSLSPFPTWALVLLTAAAAAGGALALLALRSEPHAGRRRLLIGLRLAAAVALVFLVLEPGRRLMQTTRVKNRVVILLDKSASMGFPATPGGGSRSEAMLSMLESSSERLEELGSRFTVELLGFDRHIQTLEPGRLPDQLQPTGTGTDIAAALRESARGTGAAAGRRLSGILLVSDGADTSELASGLGSQAREYLQGLEVPISTVLVGGEGVKDLAMERVEVDDFAFVRNTVEVSAVLRVHGLGGVEVPVVLKREGRVIASRVVRIQGPGAYPVHFSFSPDHTGHFVYTIEAPVLSDEAVAGNNVLSFPIKVIRDRVRVLLVVGHPSWDVRFLRGLLKQDPNIDLVSFFILRTSSDSPQVLGDDELSLIPFPVHEIFHEQLRTFDLVVLQNFAYDDRAYQMSQYLAGIADYVHDGGALVMVGGENSFGEGRYDRTELQAALPVVPTGLAPAVEPFPARLTEEGQRHPVTAVGFSGDSIARAWSGMPELAGIHVTRPKPGTQVLLEHPFLKVGEKNAPVVVLGEHGRGRVMAVLADTTWVWSFGSAAGGEAARVYEKFWANAIRWLVRDPDLTPIKMTAEKTSVEPGEPVVVVVSARRPDFGPATGAAISLEVVSASENRAVARQEATAGSDGESRVELGVLPPGAYKLVARVALDGLALGEAYDAVAVRSAGPELADAAPRRSLLEEIASLTGGTLQESVARLPRIPLVDPETVEVGRRKDLPLWDHWAALTLLVFGVGGEWLMRRRWGYP
jgi:uncharacterized membrane protein